MSPSRRWDRREGGGCEGRYTGTGEEQGEVKGEDTGPERKRDVERSHIKSRSFS